MSKDVDPLLEIDRNPRKLELFLSNYSPSLTVGDLRKFLHCTINVDPYLRKLIRGMFNSFLQNNRRPRKKNLDLNSFQNSNKYWKCASYKIRGIMMCTIVK